MTDAICCATEVQLNKKDKTKLSLAPAFAQKKRGKKRKNNMSRKQKDLAGPSNAFPFRTLPRRCVWLALNGALGSHDDDDDDLFLLVYGLDISAQLRLCSSPRTCLCDFICV